jgi:hypothetical protein
MAAGGSRTEWTAELTSVVQASADLLRASRSDNLDLARRAWARGASLEAKDSAYLPPCVPAAMATLNAVQRTARVVLS